MPLHMIKLCVGATSVDDLIAWQARNTIGRAGGQGPYHDTRMSPKRGAELTAGGSLYWVIQGRIQVRQRIVGLEGVSAEDGTAMCRIHLDPRLVRTRPRPKRPFQGWRYFEASDAPPDLDGGVSALSEDLESALKDALVW